MISKWIRKTIQLFKTTASPITLGRWNNNHTNYQKNKKIDWSNHDHCGPCGNLNIPKNDKNDNSPK